MIGAMGELILLRHGETEWSRDGRHTGRTDIPLTPRGVSGAAALAPMVQRRAAGQPIVAVFTSPAQRAVKTAELAGLGGPGARVHVRVEFLGAFAGLDRVIDQLSPEATEGSSERTNPLLHVRRELIEGPHVGGPKVPDLEHRFEMCADRRR